MRCSIRIINELINKNCVVKNMSSLSFEHANYQFNGKNIEIKLTPNKGRGVFAKKIFSKDEIIESCQIITFSEADADKLETTYLSNYWYAWKENADEYGAFCLGNGALFNHSSKPNARVVKDFNHNLIHFIATEEIPIGEEITFKYGTVWFKEQEK